MSAAIQTWQLKQSEEVFSGNLNCSEDRTVEQEWEDKQFTTPQRTAELSASHSSGLSILTIYRQGLKPKDTHLWVLPHQKCHSSLILSTLECSMKLDSGVYVWAPRWHVLMENELYHVRGLLVVSLSSYFPPV